LLEHATGKSATIPAPALMFGTETLDQLNRPGIERKYPSSLSTILLTWLDARMPGLNRAVEATASYIWFDEPMQVDLSGDISAFNRPINCLVTLSYQANESADVTGALSAFEASWAKVASSVLIRNRAIAALFETTAPGIPDAYCAPVQAMSNQPRTREFSTPTLVGESEPENRAVALRSMPLSAEAAAAMERMLADPTIPAHEGSALPTVSAQELLRRFGRQPH